MVCIYCGHDTRVINSRLQRRSNRIWRRRKCTACGAIFTTTEAADYEKSWVVQYADGRISPFLRDKLLISIYNSCRHRPAALSDAIGLSDTVINKAAKCTVQGLLKASDLAAITHRVLGRFDAAAAVSYQAFHADNL